MKAKERAACLASLCGEPASGGEASSPLSPGTNIVTVSAAARWPASPLRHTRRPVSPHLRPVHLRTMDGRGGRTTRARRGSAVCCVVPAAGRNNETTGLTNNVDDQRQSRGRQSRPGPICHWPPTLRPARTTAADARRTSAKTLQDGLGSCWPWTVVQPMRLDLEKQLSVNQNHARRSLTPVNDRLHGAVAVMLCRGLSFSTHIPPRLPNREGSVPWVPA